MSSVLVAFELTLSEIDNEIERTTEMGISAMRETDMAAAKAIIEQTEGLLDFRERLEQFNVEWESRFEPSSMKAEDEEHNIQRVRSLILSGSKSPKTGLQVKLQDGTLIQEEKASDTLAVFISHVGFEKVRSLKLKVNSEELVSQSPSKKYTDTFLNGYYVKTHSNTMSKKRLIEAISAQLGLGVAVQIISPS